MVATEVSRVLHCVTIRSVDKELADLYPPKTPLLALVRRLVNSMQVNNDCLQLHRRNICINQKYALKHKTNFYKKFIL